MACLLQAKGEGRGEECSRSVLEKRKRKEKKSKTDRMHEFLSSCLVIPALAFFFFHGFKTVCGCPTVLTC